MQSNQLILVKMTRAIWKYHESEPITTKCEMYHIHCFSHHQTTQNYDTHRCDSTCCLVESNAQQNCVFSSLNSILHFSKLLIENTLQIKHICFTRLKLMWSCVRGYTQWNHIWRRSHLNGLTFLSAKTTPKYKPFSWIGTVKPVFQNRINDFISNVPYRYSHQYTWQFNMCWRPPVIYPFKRLKSGNYDSIECTGSHLDRFCCIAPECGRWWTKP